MQANLYIEVKVKDERHFIDSLEKLCQKFAKSQRNPVNKKLYKVYYFQFEG